jgi:hypothetical protein
MLDSCVLCVCVRVHMGGGIYLFIYIYIYILRYNGIVATVALPPVIQNYLCVYLCVG